MKGRRLSQQAGCRRPCRLEFVDGIHLAAHVEREVRRPPRANDLEHVPRVRLVRDVRPEGDQPRHELAVPADAGGLIERLVRLDDVIRACGSRLLIRPDISLLWPPSPLSILTRAKAFL